MQCRAVPRRAVPCRAVPPRIAAPPNALPPLPIQAHTLATAVQGLPGKMLESRGQLLGKKEGQEVYKHGGGGLGVFERVVFANAAGFLRIKNKNKFINPLDDTRIHPEAYKSGWRDDNTPYGWVQEIVFQVNDEHLDKEDPNFDESFYDQVAKVREEAQKEICHMTTQGRVPANWRPEEHYNFYWDSAAQEQGSLQPKSEDYYIRIQSYWDREDENGTVVEYGTERHDSWDGYFAMMDDLLGDKLSVLDLKFYANMVQDREKRDMVQDREKQDPEDHRATKDEPTSLRIRIEMLKHELRFPFRDPREPRTIHVAPPTPKVMRD